MKAKGAKPSRRQRPKKISVERRLLAQIASALGARRPETFVQLVAGGGYNILYALDASGQVWKFRHAYDKETKQTSDERWVPVSMERRDK